jgi:hypothetical protein
VSFLTRADLGGLGTLEGAPLAWAIPAGVSGTQPGGSPGVQPAETDSLPFNLATAARPGNTGVKWWAFALVLCLALFLVSRLKSNAKR